MSAPTTLESLLIDKLRDMYQAERQLAKALPKLIKAAKSPQVRAALQRRLSEASEHLVRLEVAFDTLDRSTPDDPADDDVHVTEQLQALAHDANLMAEAQRAQHHHIAAYRTLTAWATALGQDHVARLLSMTLDQEIAAEAAIDDLAGAAIREIASGDRSAAARAKSTTWGLNSEKRLIPRDFMSLAGK